MYFCMTKGPFTYYVITGGGGGGYKWLCSSVLVYENMAEMITEGGGGLKKVNILIT